MCIAFLTGKISWLLLPTRYKENRATPLELGAVPDTLELIGQLIEVFEKAVGGTRGSLQETLSLFEADETNYKQRRGLAHLLSSYYSNFEAVSPLEPEALRYKVFAEAAKSPPRGCLQSTSTALASMTLNRFRC